MTRQAELPPGKNPPRIAVIGIDGSGKSTAVLRVIRLLDRELRVVKPGRNPFVSHAGQESAYLPHISAAFEAVFRRADASRRRWWIGLTRIVFVAFQGWLEPRMIRIFRPDALVFTRCPVLDSAVYAGIYYPVLGRRVGLRTRPRWAGWLARLGLADLYILLETPPAVAMQRIHARISKTAGYESQPREYWLHLHEHEDVLARIAEQFEASFAAAQSLGPFSVLRIDTTGHSEEGVAEIVATAIRQLIEGRGHDGPGASP